MQKTAKDRIRKAAISLFADKGFAATTTREICEGAGVTKPVLYYYYQNKELLYRELVHEASEQALEQLVQASLREGTAREKLIHVTAASFALTMRDRKMAMIFLRMVFPSGEGEPGIDCVEMGGERARLIAKIVAEGVRRGEMRGRPSEIARALLGIHLIYSMSYVLAGGPKLDRNLARRLVDLLVNDGMKSFQAAGRVI
jgi:TetR/AcrR family transcriptional regulator